MNKEREHRNQTRNLIKGYCSNKINRGARKGKHVIIQKNISRMKISVNLIPLQIMIWRIMMNKEKVIFMFKY